MDHNRMAVSSHGLALATSRSPPTDPYALSPPNTPTKVQLQTTIMPADPVGEFPDTPPSTPVRHSHSASGSLSSLRRGDSTSSHTYTCRRRNNSIEEEVDAEEAGSKELRVFKYWISDYEIEEGNKKKPLGSGLWSDVYLALPYLPSLSTSAGHTLTSAMSTPISILTPPITPVKSRTSTRGLPSLSRCYAIKHPTSKAAKAVLGVEANILSYLSRFPDSGTYVVPFHGLDLRTGALVLGAMDTTLESFTTKELNSPSEAARAQKLKSIFPSLARDLIAGLEWLGKKGVIHADIKPANILLSTSTPSSQISAVYSDFSSSVFLSPDPLSQTPNSTVSLGGGTWDYLDPLFLSSKNATPTPTPQSDLWALAVTLLTVHIGASPFDGAGGNVFRKREMVKQGDPLGFVGYGDEGVRNLGRLRGLDVDMGVWFEMVLVKDAARRVGVDFWGEEFEKIMGNV